MAPTFLASFRSADGRFLARAMAALLVVAGCLGAIHSGRMAEAATIGAVVCSVTGTGGPTRGAPIRPTAQHDCICCVLGCSNAAACVLPGAIARLAKPSLAADKAGLVEAIFLPATKRLLAFGARGPPVLT